jgi:hypothetical protein
MPKNKVQFQKGLSLSDFLGKCGTGTQCREALVKLRRAAETLNYFLDSFRFSINFI